MNVIEVSLPSDTATLALILDPWEKRTAADTKITAVVRRLAPGVRRILPEARALSFPSPSIPGIGKSSGGFGHTSVRSGHTPDERFQVAPGPQRPPQPANFVHRGIVQLVSGRTCRRSRSRSTAKGPDPRRFPCKMFSTACSCTFGGFNMNDFNKFGRVFQRHASGQARIPRGPEAIGDIYVRNSARRNSRLGRPCSRSASQKPAPSTSIATTCSGRRN